MTPKKYLAMPCNDDIAGIEMCKSQAKTFCLKERGIPKDRRKHFVASIFSFSRLPPAYLFSIANNED
jgi:hypothetical protein